ncbi:MAG: hypothetical protein ACI4C1_09170 [Lachnospiraceae bacterium]
MRDYYDCDEPEQKKTSQTPPQKTSEFEEEPTYYHRYMNSNYEDNQTHPNNPDDTPFIDETKTDTQGQSYQDQSWNTVPQGQPRNRRFADEESQPRNRRFADEERPYSTPPNTLAKTAFFLSLTTIVICCCTFSSNMTIFMVLLEVVSITMALLSRQGGPMHKYAIAAIVISSIMLALTAALFAAEIYIKLHPDVLLEFFREYVKMLKQSGFSSQELEYFRQLFRQMGIDPSDVGLFLHIR